MLSTTQIGIAAINAAAARIAPHILATPTLPNNWLSECAGALVSVKWESQQLTGSFKLRGALNKMICLKERGIDRVMAVSAGNHGLGLAYAARLLNMRATIVVPANAAQTKVTAIQNYRADLIVRGENYDEAEAAARELAAEQQIEFVSPYNDAEVIAGQATAAIEMFMATKKENCAPLDLLLVPVGGGGLLAGVAIAARELAANIEIVGAQAANSTAMQTSFRAGRLVNVSETPTCADGLSGNIEADSITFPIIKEKVDDIVVVSEAEIEQTIVKFLACDHQVVEGSGAVGAAAIVAKKLSKSYQHIGVIATGRNIDLTRLSAMLQKNL